MGIDRIGGGFEGLSKVIKQTFVCCIRKKCNLRCTHSCLFRQEPGCAPKTQPMMSRKIVRNSLSRAGIGLDRNPLDNSAVRSDYLYKLGNLAIGVPLLHLKRVAVLEARRCGAR